MSLWEYACVVAPHLKKSKPSSAGMSEERLRELGIEGF